MRRELGKELRKQFAKAITRTFPGFVETKAPSVWPGARMYAERTPHGSFVIRLVPYHNRDVFRVMYGWSSSGEPPDEDLRHGPEPSECVANDDGYEFRIMTIVGDAGGKSDREWVIEDAMGDAFEHTLEVFAEPGDTPLETLERATTEGLDYITRIYEETSVEQLLPKIPMLIDDCLRSIQQTVMPYFERVKATSPQSPPGAETAL